MGMFDTVPGLDGYQKQVALNQQQDAGQMSKLAQLLQVQEGSMKMGVMQDQLARQKRIRDELAGNTIASQGGASPALGTTSPGTPAGVPQPASIFGNQGGSGRALAARLNQIADVYERGGETETAIKYREQAQKMLPELKDETVRIDPATQKPVVVRNYKDGTTEVSPYGAVDKIEYQANGGQSLPRSGITGQMVPGIAPLQHTQSPDSIASIASAAAGRAQAEQHFQSGLNAPQYQMTDAGLVMLPKKLEQGEVPIGTPVLSASGVQLGKELKPIPPTVNNALIENAMSLRTLDKAIRLASGQPVDSSKGDVDATGWKGYLPQAILNRIDPSGVDTRAEVADIGSLKIHDRSGAAVTISESPRLMPFIPTAKDDNTTVKRKLTRLFEEAKAMQGMLADTYSKDQGYKSPPKLPNPSIFNGGAAPSAPTAGPVKVASDADYNALPSGTEFVAPDGSRRRKP